MTDNSAHRNSHAETMSNEKPHRGVLVLALLATTFITSVNYGFVSISTPMQPTEWNGVSGTLGAVWDAPLPKTAGSNLSDPSTMYRRVTSPKEKTTATPQTKAPIKQKGRLLPGWKVLKVADGKKIHGAEFGDIFSRLSKSTTNLMYGVKCRRFYCLKKTPLLLQARSPSIYEEVMFWTPWFNESGADKKLNRALCPASTFVTQIQCSGSYCGSMRLGCSMLRPGFRPRYYEEGDALGTNYFSEEGTGTGECKDGEYLFGMGCHGKYCDDIRLFCATVIWKTK